LEQQESVPRDSTPDIVFSGEVRELAARARRIADRHLRPHAARCDRRREPNREAREAAAEAGLFRPFVPEAYGGSPGGMLAVCRITEELAQADPAFAVAYAGTVLGAAPILLGGTPEQKRRWLPAVARGETLVAFCLSEKGAGSDVGAIAASAVKDGNSYVLSGEKKWTTHGGVADLYVVFALTDPASAARRLSAFVVGQDAPGLTVGKVEETMGIRSVPVAEMRFDAVRVPAASLIGGREGRGFQQALAALDRGRPCVAAQAVGAAQGALDLALVYTRRRQQFGQPISSFQMVQGMLADMAMKTEAARWLAYAAAAAVDARAGSPTRMAASAKCFATDVAMEVATDAVQLFGGYGFMEDYPVAKFFRDAKILQIYEGTNQIQRLVIARNLIKQAERLAHLEDFIPREEAGARP
jgi:alkylation response protein AidB-like acyl-CoA dehydrogenase